MKSKRIFLLLPLLLVGVGHLSAMEDQIPIPIYTSEGDPIILRTPGSIRIDCIYDTDTNTIVFGIVGSTETIAVTIVNSGTNEAINTAFIGSGLFYVPTSGNAGNWRITLALESGAEYIGVFIL